MTRAIALLSLMLAATGCMHNVEVGYLEAAEVSIAQDVQTVLVINRSAPKNAGEHVLSGAEGAITGETYRLDAESAALAIESLEAMLETAPRFEIVTFHVAGRAVDTTMWDREMTARKVRELCRQVKCDAVISLETFDSDQFVAMEHDGPTREERREERTDQPSSFEATQHTDVTATFRMYDAASGAILDEQRTTFTAQASSGTEDSPAEALGDLPHGDLVYEGAGVLGAEYAMRISPHLVIAPRNIFGGGSKAMRQARRAAKHGDLAQAEAIWSQIADSSETAKMRSKALHNLSVAAEARGDLTAALQFAHQANTLHSRQRTSRYVATLRSRMGNDRRVAAQLGEVLEVASNSPR